MLSPPAIQVLRQVLICGVISLGARTAVLPVLPGDSERGEKLFETERCIQCHSIDGKGGKTAPELGRQVDRSFTPALLASTMWNQAPVMWAAMHGAGIERPKLSPEAAADLFAFFYSTRFFDKPGEAARGKQVFSLKHCGDCHGITESRAEGAPPVEKWESLGQPVILVQQMWNHSGLMREAFARKHIAWQELTTQQLTDMQVYLCSARDQAPGVAFLLHFGCGRRVDLPVEGLHQVPYRQAGVERQPSQSHSHRYRGGHVEPCTQNESAASFADARRGATATQLSLDAAVRVSGRQRSSRQAGVQAEALLRLPRRRIARCAAFTGTSQEVLRSDHHFGVVETRPANAHSHAPGPYCLATIQFNNPQQVADLIAYLKNSVQ